MEDMSAPILKEKIRLDIIYKIVTQNWKKYIIPIIATSILTALLSLCIPRYYKVQVLLAPEYAEGSGSVGGLGGLAAMAGINLGGGASDAIAPMFYPDVLQSTNFLVPLMDVQVTTADSSFTGAYVDYLTKKTTAPFWMVAFAKVKKLFKPSETLNKDEGYKVNPFRLTELETKIIQNISNSIVCNVDKKTEVISISVVTQDPLVAALMADTVKQRLQDFITDYRTKKATIDLVHVTKLCEEAKKTYFDWSKKYADFVDSHIGLSKQSYVSKRNQIENEMNNAFSVYNTLSQQKVLAESKVQERTPVFTTLQNASVPVKHAGPKRMLAVLSMAILAFVLTTMVLLFKR